MISGRLGLWECSLFVASILLWLAVSQSDLHGQPSLNTPHTKIKGLVMAIYSDSSSKPVATFRAKKVFRSLQRRGFFRIGLLPMLVCDGVVVEFCETEGGTNALMNLPQSLKSQAGGAMIELREVEFRFPADSAPRLKAGIVRLQDNGQSQLLNVDFQSPTKRFQVPSAVLQFSGEHAGQLGWQSPDGIVAINLFTPHISTTNSVTAQKTL